MSAWQLVQHAQVAHNMRLFVDPEAPISNSERLSKPKKREREDSENEKPIKTEIRSPVSLTPTAKVPRTDSDVYSGLNLRSPPTSSLPSSMESPRSSLNFTPHSPMDIVSHLNNPFMFAMRPAQRPGQRHPPISPIAPNTSPFNRPRGPECGVEFPSGMGADHPMYRIPHGLPHFDHGLSSHFGAGFHGFGAGYDRHLRPPGIDCMGGLSDQSSNASQILRKLARTTNHSPVGYSPHTNTPMHPHLSKTPPYYSQVTPSRYTPTTSPQSSVMTNGDVSPKSATCAGISGSQSVPSTPGKKSCEFCGKQFQYQSNLIVHRRSHTGDKPFKCPLCSHRCAQASKLKRHMQTHNESRQNGTSENHDEADFPHHKEPHEKCLKETSDLEDDEDEETAMEEMRKLGAISGEVAFHMSHTGGARPKERFGEKYTAIQHFRSDGEGRQTNEKGNDHSSKHTSMLSEMMKSGFGDLINYKEAYEKAVAECKNEVEEDMSSNDGEAIGNDGNSNNNNKQDGGSRPASQSSSNDITENGIDGDGSQSGDRSVATSVSSEETVNSRDRDEDSFRNPTPNSTNHRTPEVPDINSMARHQIELYQRLYQQHFTGTVGRQTSDMYLHQPENFYSLAQQIQHRRDNGLGLGGVPRDTAAALAAYRANISPIAPHHQSGHQSHHRNTTSMAHQSTPGFKRRSDTCEYCGKVFKNCSNLTVHRRSHTGEKPYRCALCNYACAQSSKLTRHMRTHGRLGKDVYRCKFCNMPFSVASTLEKHMRKCVDTQTANRANPLLALTPSPTSAAPRSSDNRQ